MGWVLSREGRKWLYGVAVVAIPLLVLYGAIDPKAAPLWLAFLAALLGVAAPAMALAHLTPRNPEDSVTIPGDLPNDIVLDVEE